MRYLLLVAFCLVGFYTNLHADRYTVDSQGCVTVVGSKFSSQKQEKFNNKTKCTITKKDLYEISR